MRYLWILWLVFSYNLNIAQESEKQLVKASLERFFKGFHAQDSLIIKSVLHKNVIMQTIGKNQSGQPAVQNQNIHDFLKSITSIPKTIKFEEKILGYTTQMDGAMAHVWTPYEFWKNGVFSHCGVNSFQLFKDEENWKIISIIDTRRKENCTSTNTKNP